MFPSPPLRQTPRVRPDADRKRYPVRRQVALETLEGRALLSHVAAAHPGANAQPHVAQAVDVQVVNHFPPKIHRGPLLHDAGVGFVAKSPRFYEFFTGTKVGALNAAGAKAYLDGQGNAILTGIVAGTINDAPATADDSENYLFEIDRGLIPGPGPFPGRPRITFDAIVSVSITPDGTTGFVRDLTNGATLSLTADQITVGMDHVTVTLPTATLLPQGAALNTVPTVNFSPLGSALSVDNVDATSFAAEFRNIPLSLGPLRHHGRH